MSQDYELFEGKSLSSLFKDIYDNSKHNKTQLEILVKEVAGYIKDGDMAIQLIPMIKEYLEQLLTSIDDVVVDLQKKSDSLTDDIQSVKEN